MSDPLRQGLSLSPEQRAIRDKCFHPSDTFVKFLIADFKFPIPVCDGTRMCQFVSPVTLYLDSQ